MTAASHSAPTLPLVARLDVPLPEKVAVGAGTALFVCGTCFHPLDRLADLAFVVEGAEQPVIAHSMPRRDQLSPTPPGQDPVSYFSGFWGVARIPAEVGPVCEIGLRAKLRGGGSAEAPLASIGRAELPEPVSVTTPDVSHTSPLIAICMATYQPPLELFRRQIDSIRAQTHENWVCVVSDDCSSSQHYARIEAELAGEDRFILSRSPRRLGFYLNFERALALVPHEAQHVVLADQDDRWYPEKLERLLNGLGSAQLVYSDARVVDRHGEVVSDTYWKERRNNHTDLLSLLVANSVTGAASLMRRSLLDYALPFPPAQFGHFHDHWLALTALALGEINYIPEPLYDYVQHGQAALGHGAANHVVRMRERLGHLRKAPRERVRLWRLHYFVDVARLTQLAAVLDLRCAGQMTAPKRRALAHFTDAERSPTALARMWMRGLRELLGHVETLGAEWVLAYAFTWRRFLTASARSRPSSALHLDALPPPDLLLAPGQKVPDSPGTRDVGEKIAPLRMTSVAAAPTRINLLVPTVDLAHFFGGYIAKFNLALRLARRGLRVRVVTVDPAPPLPADWRRTIESYRGLAGVFDRVELEFGREADAVEVSPGDTFIATTWWTAHIAAAALDYVDAERFLYLIQEYEPFTFPMGTYAALAAESYELPHAALFSSELLRDYFQRHRIGVFAAGDDHGERNSASFQNAITPVPAPSVPELTARETRRLLFYARPEPHAARNMFELGVLALQQAVRAGELAGWELHGIGASTGSERSLTLAPGVRMSLLPRADQDTYAQVLRDHDVGLALMYTPHPSLVPLEMAAAGMLTVTNSFENKTPAALSKLSGNLLAARPTVDGVAQMLTEAAAGVGDYERRVAGSAVNWSQDWDRSFDPALIDRVLALLRGP
ncbi:MAG TPA: glycosyltransferase [Solirubrobacteraceae bacterium]|nr:glycosyltransferase [Solirubrobacteraceae bacterium]